MEGNVLATVRSRSRWKEEKRQIYWHLGRLTGTKVLEEPKAKSEKVCCYVPEDLPREGREAVTESLLVGAVLHCSLLPCS